MGQSSSSSEQLSPEQREAESLAASTGALSMLQKSFSLLSDPQTNAIPFHNLQKCFNLTVGNPMSEERITVPNEFPLLMAHLGSSIVDLFYMAEKGGVGWVEFLQGFNNCCGRTVASTSFSNLLRLFQMMVSKAGFPEKLRFESIDGDTSDSKILGSLLPIDLLMLLWMCYLMSSDAKKSGTVGRERGNVLFPDVSHLVFSAVESCAEGHDGLDFWQWKVSDLNVQLPIAKIQMWALKTVPYLADSYSQFVRTRLHTSEDKLEQPCSFTHDTSPVAGCNTNLLTCGNAWAISLTMKNIASEEISKVCFQSDVNETKGNLLYRSSLHGKGLNGFWSNVEGYGGPLLILISACKEDDSERGWIIGALTNQGLENKGTFYGTSGCLYAVNPLFNAFSSSGKEKNFVYSHLHSTGRVYDPSPKPVGIAFGGSVRSERIFIDKDFAKVTVRHHAVDKTYQPGPLFPNQGFLPVEASVLEVEVWGLGGSKVKELQNSYKKREELFTEQRRKVDLKTFASWEDSPEKMMMDMMSDPNAVRREDR